MEDAKLIVVGGDTKFKEVVLCFPTVIGRSKDCDIILSHSLVSRRHCEISSSETGLQVRDLGSLNGTYVGRERITKRDLNPGELLTIGTVTFRAVYGNWSEDDAHLPSENENLALDTAQLSSDDTKLKPGKDDTENANEGSAFVAKAGDQVGRDLGPTFTPRLDSSLCCRWPDSVAVIVVFALVGLILIAGCSPDTVLDEKNASSESTSNTGDSVTPVQVGEPVTTATTEKLTSEAPVDDSVFVVKAAGKTTPAGKNRLAKETSPYLLQHAENPVDWYPWGEEALAKAKRENKPIFLSIGYSSCHWCHVMEAESFTDAEIAAFLNTNFVCIKVDREERPDVDSIYMMAVQIMTGRGGWPLSAFLMPDGRPFFGGTYFPARDGDRGASLGFLSIAKRVKETWDQQPDAVRQSADQLSEMIIGELQGTAPTPDTKMPTPATLDRFQASLARDFDSTYGGFGSTDPNQPKFPQTPNLMFLVDRIQRTQDSEATKMLTVTLDRMAMGGLRDHFGGGFHRYSVDRFWRIPHFEKMLYDNGQLATVYAAGYQLTKNQHYKDVLTQMMDFLAREMTAENGGFYSALDADSEHVEGKFYRWERAEWDHILGEKDAGVFAAAYAEQKQPNFENEFYVPQFQSHWDVLARNPLFTDGLETVLAPLRNKLLAARAKRVRPMTDTKILTSWNGLMIRGLADAGGVLEMTKYIERAAKAANFLLANVRDENGRLHRTFGAGEARLNAYVDDYANLIDGLIALHEATANDDWLKHADELMQKQIELFLDEQHGGFYFTSRDHEALIARGKQFTDNARPAGNSTSVSNLLYLAEKLNTPEYVTVAEGTIQAAMPLIQRHPIAAPRMGVSIAAWLDR